VREFGEQLEWTFVMGGLAREYVASDHAGLIAGWLLEAERSRMPLDPLIWREAPLRSTYPASMAVRAASDQAADNGAAYLRALREGIVCFRRKLDTTDALVDLARATGLDGERFKLDLASNAVVEAFGNDLEIAREVDDEARAAGAVTIAGGRERVPFPTLVFTGEDGAAHPVYGVRDYAAYRAAAEAAGAVASGDDERLGPVAALRRFGRLATREVEEVCGLRGPRAEAELWRLALEFEVTPVRVLTGWLWEPAA
jgi:hypothetical protein